MSVSFTWTPLFMYILCLLYVFSIVQGLLGLLRYVFSFLLGDGGAGVGVGVGRSALPGLPPLDLDPVYLWPPFPVGTLCSFVVCTVCGSPLSFLGVSLALLLLRSQPYATYVA